MLESAERGKVRLISYGIIFQEFQPHDHDTSTLQSDGWTDNLLWQYRVALRSIAR